MRTAFPANLHLAATPTTPEVAFSFDRHYLALRGESYPEHAAAFYGPLLEAARAYVAHLPPGTHVAVHIHLPYFNSSSTKMLFTLLGILDQAAGDGTAVDLHWHYDQEDDATREFGEDLSADFPALRFHPHAVD